MGGLTLQILSDLHLETHPSYDSYSFPQTAAHLALLGDIGHVADDQLFTFLETQLDRYATVLFLLGNHDPYHMSLKTTKSKIRAFEAKIDKRHRKNRTGKFVFLDQTRYNFDDEMTVLGCTLFSHVPLHQKFAVENRLVDFKDILHWTVEDHNGAHQADLAWLNEQVERVEREEPHRRIVIMSHHCPGLDDPRCTDPRHEGSEVSTAFATDLKKEICWTSPKVVGWAFGHTHFNSCFADDDGKVVLTNQKGYYFFPQETFNPGRTFSFGV